MAMNSIIHDLVRLQEVEFSCSQEQTLSPVYQETPFRTILVLNPQTMESFSIYLTSHQAEKLAHTILESIRKDEKNPGAI